MLCKGPKSSVLEATLERLLVAFLRRYIRRGSLKVTTAEGNVYKFGDGHAPSAAVRFTTEGAQRAVLFDPELRLGEAYMDGDLVFERGDMRTLLALVGRNFHGPPKPGGLLRRIQVAVVHHMRQMIEIREAAAAALARPCFLLAFIIGLISLDLLLGESCLDFLQRQR